MKLVVTHLVPAMRSPLLLLLLLLTSNHPEGKKCNTGLKMKLGQLGVGKNIFPSYPLSRN